MFTERSRSQVDVVLVSMPFASLFQPSIGLSLLKAGLVKQGIPSIILYESLQFVLWIGREFYIELSEVMAKTGDLVGEWLFAESLFGPERLDSAGYIRDVLHGAAPEHQDGTSAYPKPIVDSTLTKLLSTRRQIDAFLEQSCTRITQYRPRIVGFTSSIQQHVASLSLAQKLKSLDPSIFVVFGGANVQGAMGVETIRQFPFVDAIVSGEGDVVFPVLAHRVLDGAPLPDLPGVITRKNLDQVRDEQPDQLTTPIVIDMDALPYPDYDDFFAEWAAVNTQIDLPTPRLLFETSRGCWWGQRSHCTFCGLNGQTLVFRSKSPRRALDELKYLCERYVKNYPVSAVSVVDNVLDMGYFDNFIPALAELNLGLELFYEVRASLNKQHLCTLKRSGITMVQPGIESFSNQVLKLMRKGVTRLQNIQFLKWCEELNVKPYWNLLYGFANEDPDEYSMMAELVPNLEHLHPPMACAPIRLDRFSPNFLHAEKLGYTAVRPLTAYHYIYPFAEEAIRNLAYYFAYGYREPRDVKGYVRALEHQVMQWQSKHQESGLFFVDKGNQLLIFDLRSCGNSPLTVAREPFRTLYLLCDGVQSIRQVKSSLEKEGRLSLTASDIEDALYKFVKHKLMLEDNGRYLSLAISIADYQPHKAALEKLAQLGTCSEPDDAVVLSVANCTVL